LSGRAYTPIFQFPGHWSLTAFLSLQRPRNSTRTSRNATAAIRDAVFHEHSYPSPRVIRHKTCSKHLPSCGIVSRFSHLGGLHGASHTQTSYYVLSCYCCRSDQHICCPATSVTAHVLGCQNHAKQTSLRILRMNNKSVP
jgi:hypothetical protein